MSLNSFRSGLGTISSNPIAKWVLFGVGGLLAFSLVFSGLGNNLGRGAAAGPVGTDVVATVNGDPITRDDFSKVLGNLRQSVQDQGRTVGFAEEPLFSYQALSNLVSASLAMQEAKRRGITVSPDEIKALRNDVIEKSGLRQTLGLSPTSSVAEIDAALAKTNGATIEDRLPDDTLRQVAILGGGPKPGKLLTALSPMSPVSEADVRQFYQKYHTQHILIGNKTRSDVQAKTQAEQILAKAKAPGADFGALAKQYSDDPGTKAKGGDDGLIDSLTPYVPEFKKAAFSLKPGQVTPDLVSVPQYGYFIIKLDDIQNKLPKDFEAKKKDYITQYTAQATQNAEQEGQAKLQALVTDLHDKAKIDIKDPSLAGDNALTLAGRQGDPTKAKARYQEALDEYQKALKVDRPALEKASLQASLGQVYQGLSQPKQAIGAFAAAATLHPDVNLDLTLAKLYEDSKDKANAIVYYQKAGGLAWNDQSTHTTLLTAYRRLGRADLADTELTWLKQYDKDHPQSGGGPAGFPGMTLPGGSPGMTMPGGPPAGQPAGQVRIVPPPAPKTAAPTPATPKAGG